MHADSELSCDCIVRLPDWRLSVTHLQRREERELGNVMETVVRGAIGHARRQAPGGDVGQSSTLGEVRRGLAGIGLDPERVPPASELLMRRALVDDGVAAGCLAWQFLLILTLKSQSPWSAVCNQRISPPTVFRMGEDGETLLEEQGGGDCRGLPVLADENGPLASPWTLPDPDALADCSEPLFVCYLPRKLFRTVDPRDHMGRAMWLTWAYRFVRQRSCSHRSSDA